jgi:spoIIIJ-associated protein
VTETTPTATETAVAEPATAPASDTELFRQSEIAADYIEGLLDVLDYDGDIDELVQNGRPVVEVVGGRLQALVGQRGATLEAMQELTRLAIFRQTGAPSRLLLDIGGYRALGARSWARSPRTPPRRSRSTARLCAWSRCRRSSASACTT